MSLWKLAAPQAKPKPGVKPIGGTFEDNSEQTFGPERNAMGDPVDLYEKEHEKLNILGSISNFQTPRFLADLPWNKVVKGATGLIGDVIGAVKSFASKDGLMYGADQSQPQGDPEKQAAVAEAERIMYQNRETSQAIVTEHREHQAKPMISDQRGKLNDLLGLSNGAYEIGIGSDGQARDVYHRMRAEERQLENLALEIAAKRASSMPAAHKAEGGVNTDQNKVGEGVSILSAAKTTG